MPCRRLRCRPCLLWAAWRRGLALADARPERFLTLTLVGEDWATVRARMFRLRHHVVQEVGSVEWCWSVEPNPRGTGHHVHAFQRGVFVPQARLSELARREGMGFRCDIRRWQANAGAEAYGLKGVGYGLKGVAGVEAGEVYLAENGGRLTHQSRGFFAGGVRAAEARGVAAARGAGDLREWQLVKVSDLAAATGCAGAGSLDAARTSREPF